MPFMMLSSKLPLIVVLGYFGCDCWLIIDVIIVNSRASPFHEIDLRRLLDVFIKRSVQISERVLVCNDVLDRYLGPFSKFRDRLSKVIDLVGVRTEIASALRG